MQKLPDRSIRRGFFQHARTQWHAPYFVETVGRAVSRRKASQTKSFLRSSAVSGSPVVHETTYEELEKVSLLLASRAGLNTAEESMEESRQKNRRTGRYLVAHHRG